MAHMPQVAKFFLDIEADDSMCKLDLMLVYEVYTEKRATVSAGLHEH